MRSRALAVGSVLSWLAGCGFSPVPSAPVDASAVDAPDAPPPIDAPPDAPPPVTCANDPAYLDRPGTNHRYRKIAGPVDYDTAIDQCAADGAHLVVIDDSTENAYVTALAAGQAWIGFDDLTREGTFTWVTGASSTYTSWNNNEPNDNGIEDCVYVPPSGKWNDTSCGEQRAAVCECDPAYTPPPTPACRTADGATVLQGRRYFLSTMPKTWNDAEAECVAMGAHLVAIGDADENGLIDDQFSQDAWIGYTDAQTEGTFVWSNGAPAGYTKWASGAPSQGAGGDGEDCVVLDHPGGSWNDTECTGMKAYACECDPAPP